MTLVENLMAGAELVLTPFPLLLLVLGVLIGLTMGSIPGMTATMTVAVLVPFTFTMEPITGMMLLLGIYGGALYAGSIPAILIRTPGTPSAAATLLDGFPLSEKGQAGRAIGIATVASVVGGLTSVVVLTLVAPEVGRIALNFGSPEFFALAIFGLSVIASVSGDHLLKGVIFGLIGMLIATVGIDPSLGIPRFTFGFVRLEGGVQFVALMIGLFGLSEAYRRYELGLDSGKEVKQTLDAKLPSRADLKDIRGVTLFSSAIGAFIGSLPGAGGAIASFITYNEAQRFSKDPDPKFGEGNIRGVAAAEAGNNASTGGALIPTLTLSIPGDSVSAILIGAMLIHGIRPGPQLFVEQPEFPFGMFIGFAIVYLVILVVGLAGARYWAKLIDTDPKYLWPLIIALCVVGSIAIRGNLLDGWTMALAGFIGYLGRLKDYPLAPMVLGLILGPIAEENLRRSLILSDGSPMIFIDNRIALVIIILTTLVLVRPVIGIIHQKISSN